MPPKKRSGLLAAGNFIVDHLKLIDAFPHQDGLANIASQSAGNGGSPYNVLKDLALLGAPFPLAAAGLIGRDADGEAILADCQAHGIATDWLQQTEQAATSYTDVMTVASTGRRTFFHQRGANALFDGANIDFAAVPHRIFHLGYLLLLDKLDQVKNGRSRAAELLQRARAAGLQTSVDVVSESSDRFQAIVPSALPEIDFLFVNEYEASKVTGLPLTADAPTTAELEAAGQALLGAGVQQWVFIHYRQGVSAFHREGAQHRTHALPVPQADIQGAAGAGDALAAGVLYGLHQGWPLPEALQLGVSTAAVSLYHPSCSGSVGSLAEVQALAQKLA
jgi:sugar/nucleoside kinase (ribokinase family)